MKKILKIIIIIPFALIGFYIALQIIGIICNNISGDKQTKSAVNFCESRKYEVLDSRTFVGNNGNGNHVDLLSYLIIKSDLSGEEIKKSFETEYKCANINNLEDEIKHEKEMYTFSQKLGKMKIPQKTDNCYYVVIYDSAPFSDNIMGH